MCKTTVPFSLFNKPTRFTDVVFEVGPTRKLYYAHSVVLSRCQYYKSLFFSSTTLPPTRQLIQHHDINIIPFELLMRYLYTGTLGDCLPPPLTNERHFDFWVVTMVKLFDVGKQMSLPPSFFDELDKNVVVTMENVDRIWRVVFQRTELPLSCKCVDLLASLCEQPDGVEEEEVSSVTNGLTRGQFFALVTHRHFWVSRKTIKSLVNKWCLGRFDASAEYQAIKGQLPKSRTPFTMFKILDERFESCHQLLHVPPMDMGYIKQMLFFMNRSCRKYECIPNSVRFTYVDGYGVKPPSPEFLSYSIELFIQDNDCVLNTPNTLLLASTPTGVLLMVDADKSWGSNGTTTISESSCLIVLKNRFVRYSRSLPVLRKEENGFIASAIESAIESDTLVPVFKLNSSEVMYNNGTPGGLICEPLEGVGLYTLEFKVVEGSS